MYKTQELLDLNHTIAKDYLSQFKYPWMALKGIGDLILKIGSTLGPEYKLVSENVWIHETAKVYTSAYIEGPCIIGPNSEVRHCAFIRGKALVGENCVVGNSCELKNVILFDNVQTPHFNYVGDSILGYKSHMGAGSITSNFRSDKGEVIVHELDNNYPTGGNKMGAILGDYVEVGCNSVLNPGTIVGRNSQIYPVSCVRGLVKENSIYKNKDNIVEKIEK